MTFAPMNTVVWTEIHVRDLDASAEFYAHVTGIAPLRTEMLGTDVAIFGGMDGSGFDLQVGEPGNKGSVTYIAAEGALTETLERVRSGGGKIVGEPVTIPAGTFCQCADLDGNVVGFFETAA